MHDLKLEERTSGRFGDAGAETAALFETLALQAEFRRMQAETDGTPCVVMYHVPGRTAVSHLDECTKRQAMIWLDDELELYMQKYSMNNVKALFAAGSPIRVAYAYVDDNDAVVTEGNWPELMSEASVLLSQLISGAVSVADELESLTRRN